MSDSKELTYIKALYQAGIIKQEEFDKAEMYLSFSSKFFTNYPDAIEWLIQNRAISRDRQEQVKADFASSDLADPNTDSPIEKPTQPNQSESISPHVEQLSAKPKNNNLNHAINKEQLAINYNNNIMLLDELEAILPMSNQQYQAISAQMAQSPDLTLDSQQQLIDWLIANKLPIIAKKTSEDTKIHNSPITKVPAHDMLAHEMPKGRKSKRPILLTLVIIYCLYRFFPGLWQEWQTFSGADKASTTTTQLADTAGSSDNATSFNKYEAAVFNGIQDIDYLIAKKQPQSPKLIDMIDSVKPATPCRKTNDNVFHCSFTIHYHNNQGNRVISGSYPLAVEFIYRNDVLVVKSLDDFMKDLIDGMYQDQKKSQSQR